jgi:hypothetical protein
MAILYISLKLISAYTAYPKSKSLTNINNYNQGDYGETGIRTLGGGLALDGFQDRCFKPLSHLSERERAKYTATVMSLASYLCTFAFF